MIILKQPIYITKSLNDQFETYKKILLFSPILNWFIIINDFKIDKKETITKQWGFLGGKSISSIEYYITEFNIITFNTDKKYWVALSEKGLNRLLYDNDLSTMRNTFVNRIKTPLESLGVTFNLKNPD